jgi:hypothetical protein
MQSHEEIYFAGERVQRFERVKAPEDGPSFNLQGLEKALGLASSLSRGKKTNTTNLKIQLYQVLAQFVLNTAACIILPRFILFIFI